jgi:predicted HAD superfamily phosphohydrolase YqeG
MERERADWWRTVRQSLPQAGRVFRNLVPTFEFRGIDEISDGFLQENGIRGIIWDIDGTLTAYHAADVDASVRVAAGRLFASPGLRHVIVSNCDEARYEELGGMFPQVSILKAYETEAGAAYRTRVGETETWAGAQRVQHMRPIRKPSAELTAFAVHALGMEASAVVMIGDQYWTDVAGANLGGVRSMRIRTVARETFPLPLRLFQVVDRALRRVSGWLG